MNLEVFQPGEMGEDLLSLKWNNHKPAFFHLLKLLREKGCYSDVTLACGSKFFSVHRLVLMACSDFFSEVFDHTQCQKPVIVLKDIKGQELEALLDYMYLGEVNVQQVDLPGLIKAAECLRIKGLAVPDEDPTQTVKADSQKFSERPAKRRRQEREARESDRGSDRTDVRTSYVSQANPSQYSQHRTDIEIIQNSELNSNIITVSHAGGETHINSHDGSLVQRSDLLKIQTDQTLSPSRSQSLETRIEHESHHQDTSQGQLNSGIKHIETYTEGGTEIKVEQCDLEVDMEPGCLKNEVSEIQSNTLTEVAGGGEFAHFMTIEESLPHHMFQTTQQAGPSGLLRSQGRDTSSEAGNDDSLNRSGVVGNMYPSHLLAEATTEASASGVANQSDPIPSLLHMVEGRAGAEGIEHDVVPGSSEGGSQYSAPQRLPNASDRHFECMFCGRIFNHRGTLTRHVMIHTGEKPFVCQYCNFRTSRKSSLAYHVHSLHMANIPPE
ncbi:hypothetical protein SK128_009851 [Halocaridina rubra]|uniref:Broad-complex n=1 Tax=Halocaridina rubra TaxID=373956 RepID=A0AAN8XA77_HALRR